MLANDAGVAGQLDLGRRHDGFRGTNGVSGRVQQQRCPLAQRLVPKDEFAAGAAIFGYHVHDPQRYGVVEFDEQGRAISIVEKPKAPKSHFAVPGLYIYDNEVVRIARALKPSARGELEITDLNMEYLRRGQLRVHRLSRGFAWLDAGTSTSLHDASAYVQTIETRQGIKIGCPEEAAFRRGFLPLAQLEALAARMPQCEYRDYVTGVVVEARRLGRSSPA